MTIEAEKGESIDDAVIRAIRLLKESDYFSETTLIFNDIELYVNEKSFPPDILRIYSLKHELRRIS